jgi:DNA-binding GntR family transcriptional regulator
MVTERASEVIAQRLRRMVITEELTPGSIVSEADLSKQLGCSRTPLRRALHQLSHEYLVDIPPRRGILIPQLSVVDYQQLSEAQLHLAVELVDLVVERINDAHLEQLRDTIVQQEECGREGDFYRLTILDGQFHTVIVDATGNRYFSSFSRQLQSSLSRFLYRAYSATGGAEGSIEEHNRIVEALELRDAVLAKSRLSTHVTEALKRVLNIIALGDHTHAA